MIIYSDLYLEPFIQIPKEINDQIKFLYSEGYNFDDSIKNNNILFIFSDYFRMYDKQNIEKIHSLIKNYSISNHVYLAVDLLFDRYVFESDLSLINANINISDFDLSLGSYSQFPFNKSGADKLLLLILKIYKKIKSPIIKSIFVDLDNTLIPGVWEEDKKEIKETYFENSNWYFLRLINILKKAHSHGTQVIIVSKNDKKSIIEALEFISFNYKRFITFIDAGWNSKSERIKALINNMNIGAQDCIFIDDNEIEIKQVADQIPSINIFHFQGIDSIKEIEEFLFGGIKFKMNIDQDRNEYYTNILSKNNSDLIDTKSRVDYKFDLFVDHKPHNERIKELSVKTNQMNFNKTEIINIDLNIYKYISITCSTEFSNLGIVGYFVFNKELKQIENFVMSCRALGFGLENDFLDYAMTYSKTIKFVVSERNSVAQKLIKTLKKNGGNSIKII